MLSLLAALALTPTALAAKVFSGSTDTFDKVSLQMGGYLQPRFSFEQEDPTAQHDGDLGFALRRARFETAASFVRSADGVDGWTGPSLATGMTVELMPEARLQDAWVDLRLAHPLQLRLGQFKAPTTRNQLVSTSAVIFQDLSELADLAPEREIGAQLMGFVGQHHLDYAAGVFNGEGTNRLSNVNDELLMAGRLTVSPLGAPSRPVEVLPQGWSLLGEDAPLGAYDPQATFSVGGTGFRNVTGAEGTQEGTWGVGADAFFHYRWVNLSGEWLTGQVDWEDENIADYGFSGWYAQAAIFPPMVPWAQDHLALIARVQQHDALIPDVAGSVPLVGPTDENQEAREVTMGVALFAGAPWFGSAESPDLHAVRAQLQWSMRQELESLDYDNDELLLATQVAF